MDKLRQHLKEGNPFGTGDSATKHHAEEDEGEEGGKEPTETEKEDGSLQKR